DQFIDGRLETTGRVVTLAAGNSNNQQSHASGAVAQGAVTNLVLSYAAGATQNDTVEIWYDGHDRFTVTVTVPTSPATVVSVSPGMTDSSPMPGGSSVVVRSIGGDARKRDNGSNLIITHGAGQAVTAG